MLEKRPDLTTVTSNEGHLLPFTLKPQNLARMVFCGFPQAGQSFGEIHVLAQESKNSTQRVDLVGQPLACRQITVAGIIISNGARIS